MHRVGIDTKEGEYDNYRCYNYKMARRQHNQKDVDYTSTTGPLLRLRSTDSLFVAAALSSKSIIPG